MKTPEAYFKSLKKDLEKISTAEKAKASRRYFPNGINCIGATATDIKTIIVSFQQKHPELTPLEFLSITEYMLKHAEFSEEILLAFGLINKFVKRHFDDNLLIRFEYWLESYATNWAHVDDLCLKTIFPFFMTRPHLIEKTQQWAYSDISWCRRASNVVWVKFIKRKMGKSTYSLDTDLVFKNCDLLINDNDEFVQKSVGWLLKVTSAHYQAKVAHYIQQNIDKMTRPTLRYAIEKMDADTRKQLLSIKNQ